MIGDDFITYCISDVHGCYDEFMALLELINFGIHDTLYVLGDVIDRGEAPIKCLQFIMSKPNIQMLMGNHELMMTDTMIYNKNHERWLGRNGGMVTYEQLQTLSEPEQKAILDFVSNLPYYHIVKIRSKRFLLVHAGLDLQDRKHGEPLTKTIDKQDPFNIVWIRKEFYMNKALPSYITVFGHTGTYHLNDDAGCNIWHDKHFKDKICIDCGCYSGRQLSALRLDDMKEFYVPNNKNKQSQGGHCNKQASE